VRYRQPLANCRVTFPPLAMNGPSGRRLCVEFEDPQRAVAEGQTLVLYQGDRCLGGGLIVSAGQSYFERDKPLPPRLVRWAVGGEEGER
jgi:tRNA-specific 2-thiouridylase